MKLVDKLKKHSLEILCASAIGLSAILAGNEIYKQQQLIQSVIAVDSDARDMNFLYDHTAEDGTRYLVFDEKIYLAEEDGSITGTGYSFTQEDKYCEYEIDILDEHGEVLEKFSKYTGCEYFFPF